MFSFKKWVTICTMSFVAQTAVANGVMMEMFQMKKQLNALVTTQDQNEFQEAAKNFIDVAEKARETMPASLNGNEEMFKGYQLGMQEVIDVVKNAQQLAEQGKLNDAKRNIVQLEQMKAHYHREYK